MTEMTCRMWMVGRLVTGLAESDVESSEVVAMADDLCVACNAPPDDLLVETVAQDSRCAWHVIAKVIEVQP